MNTLTGAEPSYFATLQSVGMDTGRAVRRAKAASNAWDDMAAAAVTGEGFAEARDAFWRAHNEGREA